jgi:hypothetical protein
MSNESIIRRLRETGVRYSCGEITLPELQQAVLTHGLAIEGAPAAWRDLINDVEGRLDVIRFTVGEGSQRQAALMELSRLREAADALALGWSSDVSVRSGDRGD